jgi:hypothetical protein
LWCYRATPKTGKSSTGQTPRTTRAPVNDDDDEDAEVDAEGDEKHSKDNKLAQWVRNTRKWVCIDDLGIEFSVSWIFSTTKKKKKKKKKEKKE